MGMASGRGSCQRGLLDWVRVAGAGVPEEDLSCVGATDYEGGVEGGEACC